MNIPFSPPDITQAEVNEVAEALRSGWITTGPKTKELERRVAQRCGTEYAVCLNSQTACSEMALRLMGVGPGDEGITTAYTYTATASVICHVGATPVLIDTQENSLEMDYDAMEAAITERTKVIFPVDLAGIPCDYERIYAAVERKRHLFRPLPESRIQRGLGRIVVLADTAPAFGAMLGDRPEGCVADFSSFSFHAVKNLTTAEGGALTWNPIPGVDGAEIYKKLQLLSLHGQSTEALAQVQLGAWDYDIVGTWYKCNMTDLAAAVGLAQTDRYDAMLARRREIIGRYDAALQPLGVQVLGHYSARPSSSGHLYLSRVPGISFDQRGEIIQKMAARGIACSVHYKPLPLHTAYKDLGFDIADYPNAYAHFENEITLPLHTRLTDEEGHYVIDNYADILKEYL